MPNEFDGLFKRIKQNTKSEDDINGQNRKDLNEHNAYNITKHIDMDLANFDRFIRYAYSRFFNNSEILPASIGDATKIYPDSNISLFAPSNSSGLHSQNTILPTITINTKCIGADLLKKKCESLRIFLFVAIISSVFLVFFIYFFIKIINNCFFKKKKKYYDNNNIPYCTILEENFDKSRKYKSEPLILNSSLVHSNNNNFKKNNFLQEISYKSLEQKIELNL